MVNPTKVVSKVVFISSDNKTLLIRRSETDTRRPLQWDLAGGMVDPGETVLDAAIRETKEETGITLLSENVILSYTKAAFTEMGNVCWLFFVYQLTETPEVLLSKEHDKYQWVSFQDAIDAIEYTNQRDALNHIQKFVLG